MSKCNKRSDSTGPKRFSESAVKDDWDVDMTKMILTAQVIIQIIKDIIIIIIIIVIILLLYFNLYSLNNGSITLESLI